MGLWGNSQNNGGLMPSGLGGGPTDAQKQLFAQAAQDSGLSAMGMQMADQMTGGNAMKNEDQLQAIYHLMAAHPNEVALFFLHYPEFLSTMVEVIRNVFRQELWGFFNSEIQSTMKMNQEAGTQLGYTTITQENIDTLIAKAAPMDKMQMEVHQADMSAVQQMNAHASGNMQQQMMQQQQLQQQQLQQQMMMQQQMPQRQGLGAGLAGFGSSLIRGSLGLPPAQQQPMMQPQMGYQQMPPQM